MLPVPVEDISDKFFQKCRIRAVHRGKLHTASSGARIRACPRAVERKDPDRRQLVFRLVLADRLAEFPALADHIEDIVRELEEIAERKPERLRLTAAFARDAVKEKSSASARMQSLLTTALKY